MMGCICNGGCTTVHVRCLDCNLVARTSYNAPPAFKSLCERAGHAVLVSHDEPANTQIQWRRQPYGRLGQQAAAH